MKPFSDHIDDEQSAIVWAAAVSWNIPAGDHRRQLRAAFDLVNPLVDIGDGSKSIIATEQAKRIRDLVGWQNLERNGSLTID